MAHTSPFLPEPFGFDPALSILAALGVEDFPAAVAPADGGDLADAIVNPAHSSVDFESGDSATATTPARGLWPAEAEESASDLMGGLVPAEGEESASGHTADLVPAEAAESASGLMVDLVTFAFDSIVEAGDLPAAIRPLVDLSSLDIKAAVDFGTEGLGAAPAAVGESAPVDAASAAKGGSPGPGGGGGGGGGDGVLTEYRSGSADGDLNYDIWIKFKGSGWTDELQQAFKHAADYLTDVITDDIGGGGRIGKVFVDDLYVTAEVKVIDGVGGILGQAGPTHVWSANELAAAGQMQFDVADAQTYSNKGLWDDIVTHELMHVLGFGSLWNYGADPLVSNNQYTGAIGVAAYREMYPDANATSIPVEDGGGSGTAGAHWDEQALLNELMTGYINDDGNATTANDNYLSKFSVMSLADLGYKVNNYFDYPYDQVAIT